MAVITQADKVKITKYLKNHSIDNIWYQDMCEALGKKVKITDYQFLEYFTDCVILELKKDSKISFNFLAKLIVTVDSFLGWVYESDHRDKVEPKVLDMIRTFREYYELYLQKGINGIEANDEVEKCLTELENSINNYYPSNDKEDSETVLYYLNQIAELNSKITELNLEIKRQEDLYSALESKLEAKDKELNKKREFFEKENANIQHREALIIKLTNDVSKLEEKLKTISAERDSLTSYKIELDKLLGEFEELKKQVSEKDELIKKYEVLEQERVIKEDNRRELLLKNEEMIDLIISKLSEGSCSTDDLLTYLFNNGYSISKNELYNLLVQIRERTNLVNGDFSFNNPSYKIVSPVVKGGYLNINVPEGCKCYDILLVSDLHIATIGNDTYSGLQAINDYCINNNINLILDSGDFFHFRRSSTSEAIKQFTGCEKVVNRAISRYPKQDGVYHAVLGGNHDKDALKYGVDPIKKLTDAREDFIYLGYDRARISFNGACSIILHHPKTKYPEPVNNEKYDTKEIIDYLNNYYYTQGINRDDVYIDIMGHFHKSGFDFINSVCIMPSYNYDRVNNGAVHMKVYFDENTKIKYLVFIPLIKKDDMILEPVTEIAYKKQLTR